MAMIDSVNTAMYTVRGGREVNEDKLLIRRARGRLVMAACDGLGGMGAGDMASQAAADAAVNSACGALLFGVSALERAVSRANEAVCAVRRAENGRMMTTIALAVISGGKIYIAHVGDTRAYVFRDGEILYQSVDHSASQAAVLAGEITAGKIRRHGDRNILLRALGTEGGVKCGLFKTDARHGDRLLLCSDGFWEPITENQMLDSLKRTKNCGDWLGDMRDMTEKSEYKSEDNASAIVAML